MQLSLKNRVYLVNTILLCITVIGALLMIWYTYKTERLFKDIIHKDIAIYQIAESLSTSLINQKGFVSYFILDGNRKWIDQFNNYKVLFKKNLDEAKSLVDENWEIEATALIETKYAYYIRIKKKVIELYQSGEREKGAVLHKDVKESFSEILELCDQFKTFHKDMVTQAIKTSRQEAGRMRYIALLGIVTVVFLSLLINYIFARHILGPIRQIVEKVDPLTDAESSVNEMIALKQSFQGLMKNAEQAHAELVRNRETLMQSEKMALLGKLAAGTAHSIRNPLTSVKMRLFSLNRSCVFSKSQLEDFNVISDEIKQINKIVENFLEFARPPRLQMKKMSPSRVLDRTIHLLDQRLKSHNVSTRLIRRQPLPETFIDPEQLKEAIANIIINACEAMKYNGLIIIQEEEKRVSSLNHVDVIKITDDGPGIQLSIQKKIFNPFFTTKDDGTGLGLSIAFNIINEHGGWLDVSSREGEGTAFIITLPVKDS